MALIRRNQHSYASSVSYDVILSQAEYDALPDSKYTDGKVYFITDTDPIDASTMPYDESMSVKDKIEEVEKRIVVEEYPVPSTSIPATSNVGMGQIAKTGYVPISSIFYSTNGANSLTSAITNRNYNGTSTYFLSIQNVYTSAITALGTIKVYWLKTD